MCNRRCNLVESKLQATIDSLPYSEQQRAIMHAAADYYFFMEGYSSGLELVSDLSGINLVQLLPEIQSYKDTLVDQISGLPLRPRLRDSVQELGVAVSDVVSSVDDGISSVRPLFMSKASVSQRCTSRLVFLLPFDKNRGLCMPAQAQTKNAWLPAAREPIHQLDLRWD
jgi:hypothetical protein